MASVSKSCLGVAGLLAGMVVLSLSVVPDPALAASRNQIAQLDWTPARDTRLGVSFVYPAKVFKPEAGDPTEPLKAKTTKRNGKVFRSMDGKAFFQTAAFVNVDRVDIAAYKARVAQTYKGHIEYERVTAEFFVLSGVRGKETFYERVYFSCGGRMISAWSMTYPQAQGALYDRIVEEIARSFRPADTPAACSG